MDVTFYMVYGNQGNLPGEAECFHVSEAYEQRAYQAGTCCYCNRAYVLEIQFGVFECLTDHGHDAAQVFAGSQFRNDPAVLTMYVELRSHNTGSNEGAVLHNRSGGLVTRALDT